MLVLSISSILLFLLSHYPAFLACSVKESCLSLTHHSCASGRAGTIHWCAARCSPCPGSPPCHPVPGCAQSPRNAATPWWQYSAQRHRSSKGERCRERERWSKGGSWVYLHANCVNFALYGVITWQHINKCTAATCPPPLTRRAALNCITMQQKNKLNLIVALARHLHHRQSHLVLDGLLVDGLGCVADYACLLLVPQPFAVLDVTLDIRIRRCLAVGVHNVACAD